MYMGEYEHLTRELIGVTEDISSITKTVSVVLLTSKDKDIAYIGKKLYALGKDLLASISFPDMVEDLDDKVTYLGSLIEDCESYGAADAVIDDLKEAYQNGKDALNDYAQSWARVHVG